MLDYLYRKLTKLTMILIKPLLSFDNDPLITFGKIAFEEGTCCICSKRLHNQNVKEGHFSLIHIFKKATWDNPTTALISSYGQSYTGFALSIICSECDSAFGNNTQELQNSIKYAIELDMRKKTILYHDVTKLDDYPLIIEGGG